MSNSLRIAIVGDAKDFKKAMDQTETAMDEAAAAAKTAGRKIDDAFDTTAESADNVASKGAQAAGGLSGIGDVVGGKWGGLMVGAGTALQFAADGGDVLNAAVETGKGLLDKLRNSTKLATAATKIYTGVQKALNIVMRANPIGIIITALVVLVGVFILLYKKNKTFHDIVNKVGEKLKQVGKFVVDKVVPALKKMLEWIRDHIIPIIKRLIGWVADHLIPAFRNMKNKVVGFVGNIKNAWVNFRNAFSTIKDRIGGIIGSIRDKFQSIVTKIKDVIGKYSDGGGGIKGALFNVVSFLKGMPGKITKATAGMWDGIKEAFRSAVNFIINKWNGLSFHVPGIPHTPFHGVTISTPNITPLATGGIVTAPTLALIGEAGDEAVIPLDGKHGLGGNFYQINVNVAPGGNLVEAGRQMTKAIDAYERAGGRRRG